MPPDELLTASHWGPGVARIEGDTLVDVGPHVGDPDPSPINTNIARSLNGDARVLRPAVRKGWLNGKRAEIPRGEDAFVEMSWDEVLDIVAGEVARVRRDHGNQAIFGGSYGWASAGRVHHAQSQLKRFLNSQGGFVRSEGNYSYHAALVLMPHIVGPYRQHVATATRWPVIAKYSDLVIMFGGMAPRNTQVSDGGVAKHRMMDNLKACADSGVRFVNFSPLRDDAAEVLGAEWLPPVPGSDTAVMMGLAHTLLEEGLHDREFLERYTVGFNKLEAYLLGKGGDGTVKDADWASSLSDISPDRIRSLAREMAGARTMVTCAAGLQRADFGEQPMWMIVALASMLGQIGLPGGGYTIGYGVNANIGNIERPFRWGAMPQLDNPVDEFIPVAMIADMLLNPSGKYRYNGETRIFPNIKMVWWAGGNPFHHHQDLNRLRRAFQTPETVIVNEINWTATARHADIVIPVAASQEREDFGGGGSDNALVPMQRLVPPRGESRLEYDIYADLATRLGNAEEFTEGLDADGWVRMVWQQTVERGAVAGVKLPDWDDFIAGEIVHLDDPSPEQVFLADFRADPEANPLPTPSGRIEIFSERVAGFSIPSGYHRGTWWPALATCLCFRGSPEPDSIPSSTTGTTASVGRSRAGSQCW